MTMEKILLAALAAFSMGFGCGQPKNQAATNPASTEKMAKKDSIPIVLPAKVEKIERTEAEWKAQLTEQEFYVLRQKGTERAFTGDLWDNHEAGVFVCAGCRLPLFSSRSKFESGTGWPSFFEPLREDLVEEITDRSHGMVRVEVVCGRCGGHLGHVFDDGPKPTGLRYCMNSVSMDFQKD